MSINLIYIFLRLIIRAGKGVIWVAKHQYLSAKRYQLVAVIWICNNFIWVAKHQYLSIEFNPMSGVKTYWIGSRDLSLVFFNRLIIWADKGNKGVIWIGSRLVCQSRQSNSTQWARSKPIRAAWFEDADMWSFHNTWACLYKEKSSCVVNMRCFHYVINQ